MALIKLGALVTGISGKIGGQTLGSSRYGTYIRNTGQVRKVRTQHQQDAIDRNIQSSQRWRDLNTYQKEEFIFAAPDYAYKGPGGVEVIPTGFELYMQLANNLRSVGLTTLPVPLPKVGFAPLTNLDFSDVPPYVKMFMDGGDGDTLYQVFFTKQASHGVNGPYKNFFLLGTYNQNNLNNGIDLVAALRSRFGAFIRNSRSYIRIDGVNKATGQRWQGLMSGYYYN